MINFTIRNYNRLKYNYLFHVIYIKLNFQCFLNLELRYTKRSCVFNINSSLIEKQVEAGLEIRIRRFRFNRFLVLYCTTQKGESCYQKAWHQDEVKLTQRSLPSDSSLFAGQHFIFFIIASLPPISNSSPFPSLFDVIKTIFLQPLFLYSSSTSVSFEELYNSLSTCIPGDITFRALMWQVHSL